MPCNVGTRPHAVDDGLRQHPDGAVRSRSDFIPAFKVGGSLVPLNFVRSTIFPSSLPDGTLAVCQHRTPEPSRQHPHPVLRQTSPSLWIPPTRGIAHFFCQSVSPLLSPNSRDASPSCMPPPSQQLLPSTPTSVPSGSSVTGDRASPTFHSPTYGPRGNIGRWRKVASSLCRQVCLRPALVCP